VQKRYPNYLIHEKIKSFLCLKNDIDGLPLRQIMHSQTYGGEPVFRVLGAQSSCAAARVKGPPADRARAADPGRRAQPPKRD